MTYLAIIAFVLILGSLATALVFMLRGTQNKDEAQAMEGSEQARQAAIAGGKKMATALGFRVAFSVSLFLIILLLYWLGYIQPTGIPLNNK